MDLIPVEEVGVEMKSKQFIQAQETNLGAESENQTSNITTNDSSRKKIARPNFNSGGLSVATGKFSQGVIKLQPVVVHHQPNSANPFLRGKNSNDVCSLEYLERYEGAERFMDQNALTIVEPGPETKVRKHVKVLSRSNSLTNEEEASSPLYYGSPMLQKISDSSLLARRACSRNQSPLLKVTTPSDEHSTLSNSQHSTPQKISNFVEDSQRISEICVSIGEEQKTHSFKNLFVSQENRKSNSVNLVDLSLKSYESLKDLPELSDKRLITSETESKVVINTQTNVQELKREE